MVPYEYITNSNDSLTEYFETRFTTISIQLVLNNL